MLQDLAKERGLGGSTDQLNILQGLIVNNIFFTYGSSVRGNIFRWGLGPPKTRNHTARCDADFAQNIPHPRISPPRDVPPYKFVSGDSLFSSGEDFLGSTPAGSPSSRRPPDQALFFFASLSRGVRNDRSRCRGLFWCQVVSPLSSPPPPE